MSIRTPSLFLGLLPFCLLACAPSQKHAGSPEPEKSISSQRDSLSSQYSSNNVSPETGKDKVDTGSSRENVQVSTLEDSLKRVIEHNPSLKVSFYTIRAADAEVRQAQLLANPELETEIENWGGDLDGMEESETTIALTQPFLLGGKRNARTNLAQGQKQIAELEQELLARRLQKQTVVSYARLSYSQEIVKILEEQLALSKRVLSVIKAKLTAGAVLPVEQTKAEIEVKGDGIALANAKSELSLARANLASLWGGSEQDIAQATSPLSVDKGQMQLRSFSASESPYVKLAELHQELRAKRLSLERSMRVPDAKVGFGYKRLEESNSNAFLGLVSIDLPVFDRNQGSIESAVQDLGASSFNRQAKLIQVRNSLQNAQTSLRTTQFELDGIRKILLPKARKAFREAEVAYNRGRSSYLELLDAQRTLIETKKREKELLLSRTENLARIKELRGEDLRTLIAREAQ